MMASSLLSVGVIQRICEKKCAPTEPIYLQIIMVKEVERSDANSPDARYKLVFSDSIHYIQGFSGAILTSLLDSKRADTMSLIQITNHILQSLRGRWNLKILDVNPMSVVRMGNKVGDPISIDSVMPSPEYDAKPSFAPTLTTQSHPPQKSAYQPQQQSSARSGFMPHPTNQTQYNAPYNQPQQSASMTNGSHDRRPLPTIPPPAPTFAGHPQINSDEVMAFSNKQPTANKPPAIKKMTQTMQSSTTMPISALSPYTEGWTIRARCTQKTDIKTWTNAKGEGKLFSAVLIDGTGEIRMTAFNEQVDQFYEMLQPGQAYAISSGQVRPAKRAFNSTKNDYEIHLSSHSHVELDSTIESSLPMAHYEFTPIKDIVQLEKDAMVDVVAVVKEAGDCSSITTRTKQQQLSKRDLVIVDDSQCSIRLTLWAQRAEDYDTSMFNPVIVVKGAKVSDYQGRTLSATSGGDVSFNNPEVPRVRELKAWYDEIVIF